MPMLPGPDSPRPPSRKKPVRASTTGNRYSSPQPAKANPRIVGRYKIKPTKVPKGLILKKRGGNKGYVTVRKPGATPGAPGAPGTPGAAAPTTPKVNTYPEYSDFPAAQRMMANIDRDEAFNLAESQKVGDWLKGALTGLTGVDPSQPGLNPALQQQYLANVQGIVGSAMSAAGAGAGGPQVTPTTPGGIAVSPTAYLSQAAQMGNVGRSSAMLQAAQVQSALNTLQPNTQAQAYMRAYADMRAGLPAIYAERRSEARMKIDEFIEEARNNRATEAISAWNAETNAAIAAGRLGLDATKFGSEQAADVASSSAPVPEGVIRLPDGSYRNDPTYQQPEAPDAPAAAASPKPLTASQISSMQGKWNRPKSSPPKLGLGWKQPVWDPGTKRWYAKRAPGGSGGSTSKPKAGSAGFDIQKDLTYSLDNGFIDGTDAGRSIPQLVRFLRKHQPESPQAFNKWWEEAGAILKEEDPSLFVWMRDYIQRRRDRREWKGRF